MIRASRGQYRISHSIDVGPGTDWLVFRIRRGKPEEEHAPDANPFKLAYYVLVHDAHDRLRLHYYIVFENKVAVIHADARLSSYGAVGGPLPAGAWSIRIIPEIPCQETYGISWEAGRGPLPADCRLPAEERDCWSASTFPTGPGTFAVRSPEGPRPGNDAVRWYRGDLHVHTHLSDGKLSPGEMMRAAEACGFDYLMIADHNLVMTSWPKGKPLPVPGTELSARLGDCNLIGLVESPDIRRLLTDDGLWNRQAMLDMMDRARAKGALVSINHPLIRGGFWNFPELPLDRIDAMEIWNYGSHVRQPEAVEAALNVWNVLWNDGYRIPGIGGSDSHSGVPSPRREDDPPFVQWDLLMFIHADGLSVRALTDGIRSRRVYVTRGPCVDADIIVGRRTYGIGDELSDALACPAEANGEVEYALKLENVRSGEIRWIENGLTVRTQRIDGPGTYRAHFRWESGGFHWVRPEIRSMDGALQAFVNPVFAGGRQPGLRTWQETLDRAQVGEAFRIPYAMFRTQGQIT